MILAQMARDGGMYRLPALGQRPAHAQAECHGFNHNQEWLLFVVTDQWGKRKMLTVMPNELIEEAH